MSLQKVNPIYLHYGCEILLSHQTNGYINGSGYINSSLYLQPNNIEMDILDCLFRVLPLCIHSVQNDLLSNLDSGNLSEYQEKYSRLSESVAGELKTNLQSYEKLKGESIRFGSFVYLQHVKSQKFLTITPNETGIVERDCLKVILQDFPNDYSLIKIDATYNFQREGDGLIRINDIVLLEIFLNELNKPAYINSSIEDASKGLYDTDIIENLKEINASLNRKTK